MLKYQQDIIAKNKYQNHVTSRANKLTLHLLFYYNLYYFFGSK